MGKPPLVTCTLSDSILPQQRQESRRYTLKDEFDRFKDLRDVSIPRKKLRTKERDFSFQAGMIAKRDDNLRDAKTYFSFWSYQDRSSSLAEAISPMRLIFALDHELFLIVDDTLRFEVSPVEYSPFEHTYLGVHSLTEIMTTYPSFELLLAIARSAKVEGKLGPKEFSLHPEQITSLRDMARYALCSPPARGS